MSKDYYVELLPMLIKARAYFYQQETFGFICEEFGLTAPYMSSGGVVLLMEMDCGKTITSIGITGILYQFGKVNKVLAVYLLSIVSVQKQKFACFVNFLYELTILKGSSAKKKEMMSVILDIGLQIVVVNYESAWRIQSYLEAFDLELIIAEEAHAIKATRISQSKR